MYPASVISSLQSSSAVTVFVGFFVLAILTAYFLFLARALIVALDDEPSVPRKIFWVIVCLSIPPFGLLTYKLHEGQRRQLAGIVSNRQRDPRRGS